MTASVTQLYKTLFAGDRLVLGFDSKAGYESTRVAFSKLHQHTKLLLELTDDSLCARFDSTTNQGTFWIGPAAIKRKHLPFTIIESSNDAQV
jgi:hypothetical protein